MLLLLLFYYKCQAKKSVAYALTEMRAMILCSTVYKVFESDHKVTLTSRQVQRYSVLELPPLPIVVLS